MVFEKSIYNATPSAKILDSKKEEKLKLISSVFNNSLLLLLLEQGPLGGKRGERRVEKKAKYSL